MHQYTTISTEHGQKARKNAITAPFAFSCGGTSNQRGYALTEGLRAGFNASNDCGAPYRLTACSYSHITVEKPRQRTTPERVRLARTVRG